MAPASDWLTIDQAAEELEVHPRTLRRYIKDGRLVVQRLASQVVRIRPDDIIRFKDENILIKTGTGTCWVVEPEPDAGTGSGLPSTGPTGALPQ